MRNLKLNLTPGYSLLNKYACKNEKYNYKCRSILVYVSLVMIVSSCSQSLGRETPNMNPKLVLKNPGTWWSYNYKNINLSANYIALDTASKVISKDSFLKFLSSGEYIAFRLLTYDSSLKYKLYKLSPLDDKNIRIIVKEFGKNGYQQYKMEGTEIPDFSFTALDGTIYNKETTKGKIVVLKCWFIHCQVCIEEMPALNEVVKQFQNRKDIVFVSLAFDPKDSLKTFLTRRKFDYAVVPVQIKYLSEKLNVTAYPTHFIINRQGLISKVMNNYHDLISSLNNEISK